MRRVIFVLLFLTATFLQGCKHRQQPCVTTPPPQIVDPGTGPTGPIIDISEDPIIGKITYEVGGSVLIETSQMKLARHMFDVANSAKIIDSEHHVMANTSHFKITFASGGYVEAQRQANGSFKWYCSVSGTRTEVTTQTDEDVAPACMIGDPTGFQSLAPSGDGGDWIHIETK